MFRPGLRLLIKSSRPSPERQSQAATCLCAVRFRAPAHFTIDVVTTFLFWHVRCWLLPKQYQEIAFLSLKFRQPRCRYLVTIDATSSTAFALLLVLTKSLGPSHDGANQSAKLIETRLRQNAQHYQARACKSTDATLIGRVFLSLMVSECDHIALPM